jgi:holin-like protein
MLGALTTLIACQFAGEVAARALALPLPGPVLGLLLLLAILAARGGPDEALRGASNTLLRNLSLLFVPAGAGVMTQLGVLGENWLPVAASLLISTALGLGVTGWVMHRLSAR